MRILNVGGIGNRAVSALVDECVRVVWRCQPSEDAAPATRLSSKWRDVA